MPYVAKDFGKLVGMDGFSETLLKNHFTLYQGYVTNTNKLSDLLGGMLAEGKTATPEYAELKRRFGWEWNGMRLHEFYFENLGGKELKPKGKLVDMLAKEFGSFEKWVENFKACGMAARGWVILGLSAYDGRLHNYCLDTHNYNVPANVVPILVMDVYEHAYVIDYGVKRPPYIDAFMRNIEWAVCSRRFEEIDMARMARVAAS